MKKIFFCVDFEDWYHIPYLSKYGFDKSEYASYTDKLSEFLQWLNQNNIVANFFIVGEIASVNRELLKTIDSLGHEIGCHSLRHEPINKMSNDDFVLDTKTAKQEIEKAVGHEIKGYRAPYFSLTDEKLSLLKEIGFKYDSSFIKSTANEYYSHMDLTGFKKVDSLVYEDANGFKEYEIPVLGNKPIAGGGFFRLYPFFVFKKFVKKFMKRESNFVLFLHPFEIAGNYKFGGLKRLSIKDKIRFQIGRKSAEKKIKKALLFFKKQGYVFSKFV